MPRQSANVIALGLVAIGVAGLLFSTVPAIGTEGVGFAERIGIIALWAAVLFGIGRGIYGWRDGDMDRWSDAHLVVGIALALVFFALGGVYYVTVQHAPETLMMARPPITIEQAANSNLPIEMRSLATYRLAQEEFIRRGTLVKVLDPDGSGGRINRARTISPSARSWRRPWTTGKRRPGPSATYSRSAS